MEFRDFSRINLERCNTWHHISDWSLSEWAVAVTGELGEACNVIKKINRRLMGIQQNATPQDLPELMASLADEIADTFTYLDLLAQAAGFNLEEIVIDKFNRISKRENLPFIIPNEKIKADEKEAHVEGEGSLSLTTTRSRR